MSNGTDILLLILCGVGVFYGICGAYLSLRKETGTIRFLPLSVDKHD